MFSEQLLHNAISPNVVRSMGRTFLIIIFSDKGTNLLYPKSIIWLLASLKVLVLISGVFLQRTKLIWNLKLRHVILGLSFAVD